MKKVLSLSMLTVGTIIGAGFASGREIVSFFGETPAPSVAALCAALFFLFCLLFLSVGARVKADDIGTVNRRIGGRLDVVLNIALLFNSAVSLVAMLAGINSLFDGMIKLSPLYAALAGVLCTCIVIRGLKGLYGANLVMVPVLAAVMIGICVFALMTGGNYAGGPFLKGWLSALPYVGMNMMLAASVLTTVHDTTKKQRVACAAVTAVLLGGIMLLFIVAVNKNGGASAADMPILALAKRAGPVLYGLCIATVALGIFTTMLTAHLALTSWLKTLVGGTLYCAVLVMLGAFIFSFFGFKNVIDFIYPVVGGIGILYMLLNGWYLLKGAPPAFAKKLFQPRDQKVHEPRQYAKYHNRSHDKVDLKHLPAVDNQMAKPRARHDIFSHNGAHPGKADVDL
jgi:uncharacterized membrane protein YkvI